MTTLFALLISFFTFAQTPEFSFKETWVGGAVLAPQEIDDLSRMMDSCQKDARRVNRLLKETADRLHVELTSHVSVAHRFEIDDRAYFCDVTLRGTADRKIKFARKHERKNHLKKLGYTTTQIRQGEACKDFEVNDPHTIYQDSRHSWSPFTGRFCEVNTLSLAVDDE